MIRSGRTCAPVEDRRPSHRSRCPRSPRAGGRRRPTRGCRQPSTLRSAATPSVVERAPVDPWIGLAVADFTLNEDGVEQRRELESIDLLPLPPASAVGEEREPAALLAKPLDSGHRIVERLDPLIPQRVIRVSDPSRQIGIVHAEIGEREPDDLTARPRQLEAADTMPLGIGPVPTPESGRSPRRPCRARDRSWPRDATHTRLASWRSRRRCRRESCRRDREERLGEA